MLSIRTFLVHHWPQLLIPCIVVAVTLAVGYGVKRLVFRFLQRWASRTRNPLATIVAQMLNRPFMLWVLILALHLGFEASVLPDSFTEKSATVLLILWIISLTIMFSALAGNLIKYYGNNAPGTLPVTTLTQNLAQLSVVILGLVILLKWGLHLDITPILTALGVGGLAVALALQDTLSNLFSGFYIAVAGQVRLSDYIKLSSGEEGYVTDIGWRSTTIRALANNMIIIPNSKLSQAIVTNYYLPETRMSLLIPVGVSYESDPDHVEQVLLETAREAAGVIPGLLAEPGPAVRFNGFGDSSLNFTLICHVREFVDQYPVQHELRKRIFKRFRVENIEIPFPIRTVYFHNEPDGRRTEPI